MTTANSAVANQYSRAIMQLATEAGADKTLLDNLKDVTVVITANRELELVLKHPGVQPAEKKQLIISIFGGKVHDLTLRLMEMLADRRRLELIPQIEKRCQELWREKQNIVKGTLYYAEKPDAKMLAEIKTKLAKQLGKQLELDEQEDKTLIGGYVLRVGDQVIDGSLKGRLQQIEKELLSV